MFRKRRGTADVRDVRPETDGRSMHVTSGTCTCGSGVRQPV